MLRREIPVLMSGSDSLGAQKEAIVDYRVGTQTVIDVLNKHNIDIEIMQVVSPKM